MLAPQLKSKIRQLWDAFWSGGIANPLTAIEQITYLIFLKRLEDLDNQQAQEARKAGREHHSVFDVPNGETYRWSYIKRMPAAERLRHIQGSVFEWLRTLPGAEERMRDAVFVISSPNLLQRAIDIIDNLFIPSRNQDTLGDIYEMLLAEIAEAGKNGQFRTPRHIIRAMCDLVDPRPDERICDPACGTGGFLVNAYQHILKTHTSEDILQFEADGSPLYAIGDKLSAEQHHALHRNHFYGWDFDRTMVRLGWMNLIQHGMLDIQINQGDKNKRDDGINQADTLGSRFNSLLTSGKVGEFDVVLANPPFTGSIDKSDIGESLKWLGTSKTELLFVDLIIQLLRIGGRAAVIVPEGLLFGSTRAHKRLRKKLIDENQLNAVISLPGGVFQPYTGVKTSILFFTRGGETKEVWFYEVAADGYSLTAKRDEQYERNDLWDMTLKSRLGFAAAYRQPRPAFVDGDTWRDWQALDEEQRKTTYLQPRFRAEEEEQEGETLTVQVLDGFERAELDAARDWEAERDELAENDDNLSAGRYKPFTLQTVEYDPPAQILRELQEMEAQIQQGMDELLRMVEGVE